MTRFLSSTSSYFLLLQYILIHLVLYDVLLVFGADVVVEENPMLFKFQVSSPSWKELKSTNGIKFSPRHAHASCMFTPLGANKERLWVMGGKVEYYQMYNTQYSYKQADVWYSEPNFDTGAAIGADWAQIELMTGDFYAQNADAVQPGKIAPWYQRYGHTLTAYDSDKDGQNDMMILMGGFAPTPMNDIWVTSDGIHWTFHEAPWDPRGWHSAVVNDGQLFVMGGSPINSEVWRMDSIVMYNRTVFPLTRATYSSYTYRSTWTKITVAPWTPRAGMGVVSQWYYNTTNNETIADTRQRMVLVGGFGGASQDDDDFDGFRSRGDVWASNNGSQWTLLNDSAITGRAWFGMTVLSLTENARIDPVESANSAPPRMWIFGGGYLGGSTKTTAEQLGILGLTDALWSRDGNIWTRVNYEQGKGTRGYDTFVKFYSSQLWTKSTIDGKEQFLGLWGQTVEVSNNSMIMIAGDKTESGFITSTTFQSQSGIFCDIEGIICSNNGECGDGLSGCKCNGGYAGEYCDRPCEGAECD